MAKIGIIGHFGGRKIFLDGQTVKTKTLYQELVNCGEDVIYVDTYLNKTNKIKLIFDTVKCILKCNTIIILLSGNGMRIYFPIMYWIKKIFNKKIYHDVIGGNLPDYITVYPKYKKYLNAFDENWVEFDLLKKKLEDKGITNCFVIPNFKKLNISSAHIDISKDAKHNLCMFSRIMKEKGVSDAIIAVHNFNVSNSYKFRLNIWGPIDNNYQEEFNNLLDEYSEDICYKGMVDYNLSVETLTDHIALLFPTFWKGEGFPGTIIDAYAAGVPVIATDWNANSELIDNFKTGWVYPNAECHDLEDSLKWIYLHSNEVISMRKNAHKKVMEYEPQKWINIIRKKIE